MGETETAFCFIRSPARIVGESSVLNEVKQTIGGDGIELLAKKQRLVCYTSFRKLDSTIWKGGREVDCTGLENRSAARYRGFESLPFRRNLKR